MLLNVFWLSWIYDHMHYASIPFVNRKHVSIRNNSNKYTECLGPQEVSPSYTRSEREDYSKQYTVAQGRLMDINK